MSTSATNDERRPVLRSDSEGGTTSDAKPAWWHFHRRLYDWVIRWADTRYGMLVLILIAITEPIIVPIPADVMVIGMSLGKPKRAIWYGLVCSFFSVLGGTIAFCLGLAIGPERVIAFFQHISFGPVDLGQKAQQALELYQKYDFWAISIAALTPVPYMLFSWLGGMANVSLLKFIVVSAIFRPMRFGTEGVLFYFLGERARRIIEKYFNTASFVVILLLAMIAFALHYLGKIFSV